MKFTGLFTILVISALGLGCAQSDQDQSTSGQGQTQASQSSIRMLKCQDQNSFQASALDNLNEPTQIQWNGCSAIIDLEPTDSNSGYLHIQSSCQPIQKLIYTINYEGPQQTKVIAICDSNSSNATCQWCR